MRAWLYCRVTNGWDADSRDHLALQKAELERFCAEHDLTVAGATMVTGSGKKELQELVHSGVEQDTYDVLVGISATRFGGDILSLLQTGKALTEQGKGICMVRENISTTLTLSCKMPVKLWSLRKLEGYRYESAE